MEKVREPLYKIVWQSKDVSLDLAPYLISLTYTDRLLGQSDSIELVFEDRDSRWKNSWYPQKGDTLNVMIGTRESEERWLKAGIFQIDELEFASPPDTIRVRGLSSDIKKSLREKKTKAWENTTLKDIVSSIASANGLDENIEVDPNIFFKRIDQKSQSDLAFIKNLAAKYGYYTKIDHEKLIFVKMDKLEQLEIIKTIKRGSSDLISFSLRDKTTKIYKACTVNYFDPKAKVKISYTALAENVISGDVLKINERVENLQQAIEIAKSKLKEANRLKTEGSLTLLGDPYLVSGAKVSLEGFGMLSGKYIIEEATHTLSKDSGYTTSIKVRRC